jgi:hypothetical protein
LRPREETSEEEGEEEEERTEYTLDIFTQDGDGAQRTEIGVDGEDFIWIYAKVDCNKPEVDTASITNELIFDTEGPDEEWLVLGESQMVQGYKVVAVKARPPFEDAELTSGQLKVTISATIEEEEIQGPVDLTLLDYEAVFFQQSDSESLS